MLLKNKCIWFQIKLNSEIKVDDKTEWKYIDFPNSFIEQKNNNSRVSLHSFNKVCFLKNLDSDSHNFYDKLEKFISFTTSKNVI